MSEVDRLSNSGPFPALPIADRQGGKNGSARQPPPDPRGTTTEPRAADTTPDPNAPRPPKSLIDEYA
jgi:hypothetical protein